MCMTTNFNLYYNIWNNEEPVPNGNSSFEPEKISGTTIFLNGDFHNILHSAGVSFNLVKSYDTPFIYPMHLRLSENYNTDFHKPFSEIIPEHIVNRINKNGILVITDDEGHDFGPATLKKECIKVGVDLDKILYLTCNTKSIKEQTLKTMFYSCCINDILAPLATSQAARNTFKKLLSNKPEYFLCSLSNRCDEHKAIMTSLLFEEGFITKENLITFRAPPKNRAGYKYLSSLINPDLLNLSPLIDKFVEGDGILVKGNYSFGNFEAFGHCELVLMNQTPRNSKYRNFNRKNSHWGNTQQMASILLKKPFLINADVPFLPSVKEFGFKTFDTVWDESYDEETDLHKKAIKIVKILKDIKKDKEILKECEDITEYNFKHALKYDYNYKIVQELEKMLKT